MKKTILLALLLNGSFLQAVPGGREGGVLTPASPEFVLRGQRIGKNGADGSMTSRRPRVLHRRAATSLALYHPGNVGILEIRSPKENFEGYPASASRADGSISPSPGRKAIVSATAFVQLGKKILNEEDLFVAAGLLQTLSHESDPVLLGILTLAGGTLVDRLKEQVQKGEGDLNHHDRAFMLLFGIKVLDVETEKELIGLGPEITKKRKAQARAAEEEKWQRAIKRDKKEGYYPVSLNPGKHSTDLRGHDLYRQSVLPLPPEMP